MNAAAGRALGHAVVGRGPRRVIMLHGWFGSHDVYEPMLPHLDTEAFTFVFADFRGYGASADFAGTYSTDESVADVIALADALGWARFSVVGHSMGGKVAQLVAARHPERVLRAIGLTPVPASGLNVDAQAWRTFELAIEDDAYRRDLVDFSTSRRLPARWINDIVLRSRVSCEARVFGAYFESWAKDDCSAETQGCAVPLLLLVGQHDPAQTGLAMEQTCMKWFVNARVMTLEGSGHYPMQEIPVYLTEVMERFLREPVE